MVRGTLEAGSSGRLIFWAACLGMLLVGVALTVPGAILASLDARFGLGKANAGSLLTLMSFGILVGSLVFGPVVDRYGYRGLLVLCSLLTLVGLEGVAFAPSLFWLGASILLIGIGGGVVSGGTNALVSDISGEARGAGLSLVGVFFGLGAVGTPLVLGMLLDAFSYRALVAAIGLAAIPPALLFLLIRFPEPKQARGFDLRRGLRLVGDPVLLLLGLMLFLQSGLEITMGGWTVTYFQEQLGLASDHALLALSLYWLGLMLARLLLGTALRRLPATSVLPASIGVALLGSLLLLSSGSVPPAAAGVFLIGAGFGANFPLVLALVGHRYVALSGTAFSVVLVMALSGGMLLPYLTGVVGGGYGLRTALLAVPLSLSILLLLFGSVRKRSATVPAAV